MHSNRYASLIVGLTLVLCFATIGYAKQSNAADTPQSLIDKAMQDYSRYNYVQANLLFRKARKLDNQAHTLSALDRKNLDRLLDESARAASSHAIAKQSLQMGKQAMRNADFGTAKKMFRRVLEEKRYIPKSWAQEATVQLKLIEEKVKMTPKAAVKKKVKPAPVKIKTQPKRKIQKKVAAKKLRPVRKTTVKPKVVVRASRKVRPSVPATLVVSRPENKNPTEPTLLDEILASRKVQKEQAIVSYKQSEKEVRGATLQRRFLSARDILRQARQNLQRSRRLFTQSEFERLLMDVDSLAKFIDSEQEAYNQQQVMLQMKEADAKKLKRTEEIQQEKFNKIKELFAQAIKLRQEKKYQDAIDVCKQILVIEPNYERAKWFITDLEDLAIYASQRQTQDDILIQRRKVLTEGDKARISWADELKYPKNWEELSEQRQELMKRLGRTIAGATPAELAEKQLTRTFIEDPSVLRGSLRKAFSVFRSKGAKILVRWDVLELEGLSPDDDVKFDAFEGLKDLSLKTALEIILKTMGSSDIGINYAISSEGLVIVSTNDSLKGLSLTPRLGRLETRVYNIADIMAYHPSLSSIPEVQPQQEQESVQQEDLKSKEFEDLTSLEDMVDFLKTLITTVVRPSTWYDNGGEGTIDLWRKRWLVIYQSPEVHDEINALLDKLRETQTVQISLEARFVTVSSNFLEKVGMDLDVIFNQSYAGYDFTGAENTWGNMVPTGAGNAMVQPRTFSQLGALPLSPVAGAGAVPTGYVQPYGHWGLIPTGGHSSPKSSRMTPVPMLNASNTLVDPENTGLPGNLAGAAARPAFQIMGAFLDDLQVNFLLEATQMDKYSSIVQAPRVVMQNGSLGYIEVQNDVPYVESIDVVVGESSAGQEPTVDYMGFGTVLAVRPTTRDLRYVNMYIVPQLTVRAPDADLTLTVPIVSPGSVGSSTYVYPARRTTRVETVVSVPDGGTLLVGGLKMNGEIETEAGPPVLSKIPVLKRFFSNKSITRDNFTLLVLVKPTIMVREELEPGVKAALNLGQ